ncbi:MAG: 3-oxoacyl-ACP synthase [Mesonia hippocampi]|uniref:3-oxoacyl-ACP synthase n=1 Tax=Mesonia hippocampi TaxID=1628250 RepID=UPI003F94551D
MDETEVFSSATDGFSAFSKEAYKNFEINYPKFFKMDNLSKLAFLGADLLLKKQGLNTTDNDIALILANKSSSLDTDATYQETIVDKENYFPSPAVFVYTLPNICIGEISIKHKLYAENSFFIFEDFNPKFLKEYSEFLIQSKKTTQVLWGWVEYFKEDYQATMYLISKEGKQVHSLENITKIYTQ